MQVLGTLAALVESDEDDREDGSRDEDEDDGTAALIHDDDGAEGRGVRVSSEDVARMGLDVWSAADAASVTAAMAAYFGRRAYVEGKGVEVCGVRVC